MPSGRVHNIINVAAYAALSVGALVFSRQGLLTVTPVQAASFTAAYAAGTFLLSPDLDLAEGQVDSKRHWGLLGVLWVPYGMIFSHRGLSHSWVMGPLTRLLYLLAVVGLIWGLLHFLWPGGVALPTRLLTWPAHFSVKVALPFILGYYLSQWLHLTADGIRPDHGLRQGGRHVQAGRRRVRRALRGR